MSGIEIILPKIMAENFPNLVKNTNLYNNQAELTPNIIYPNKFIFILIVMKTKDKIVKAAREITHYI